MRFLRGKFENRVDPDDLLEKAEKSLQTTKDQQPHVNAIVSYLEKRNNQNGFGEDFEYTLRPKEAS